MSTTRRAFIGVIRTKRALAKAPGSSPSRLSRRALTRLRSIVLIVSTLSTLSVPAPASAAAALPVVLDVPAVGAGRCELAQLVADHRVGHENRDVLAAVVHGDRVADHGRHDHRTARPRLDDAVRALVVLPVHLLHEVVVDEGTLLQAAWHVYSVPSQRRLPDLRRRTMRASLALRLRVRPSGLPQGETG